MARADLALFPQPTLLTASIPDPGAGAGVEGGPHPAVEGGKEEKGAPTYLGTSSVLACL